MTFSDPMFTGQRKPWRISHILIGLVIVTAGGFWVVQMLRKGAFVADPAGVTTVFSSRPAAGDRAVPIDIAISAHVNPGHAVDSESLEGNVRLFLTADQTPVAARVGVSAAEDEIVLTPITPLEPETQYTFEVRGVKDSDGADLLPYVMSFTTGAAPAPQLPATAPSP